MAHLTIAEVAHRLGAAPDANFANDTIYRLLLDSRQFSSAEGVLFFALRGKNHDGHAYISQLVQKGVKHFVVEEKPAQVQGVNFIQVCDSLSALQHLAHTIRNESAATVMAITGSNGKTVVKEWLARLLQREYSVCRSPKSYNSQVGVPLSVWELEPHHQVGIFEAGISRPGEMAHLQRIIQPDLGIFTNIGLAHEANFESRQQKIQEKLKLFTQVKKLVYEEDGGELATAIKAFAQKNDITLLSWAQQGEQADLTARATVEREDTLLKLQYQGRSFAVRIPFTDEASRQNALHCLRLALAMEVPFTSITESLATLNPVEMRLQMKAGRNNNLIINDAYNSDLESLRIALHYLQHHGGKRKKLLILSDMLQTGLPAPQLVEEISDMVNRFDLHRVIAIGNNMTSQRLQVKAPLDVYPTTAEFMENRYRYHFQDMAILLKGARPFAFEQIGTLLEEQTHETVLNIYMSRMVHNLNYFRARLQPSTGIMAMVKAFSYGSGAYEIANLLQFHKVNYLGVAYTDEGVALRKAGISLPILVLNAEVSSFADLIEYRLEPEIYSLQQLHILLTTLQAHGQAAPFLIHIKLETGMHRLGFEEDQLPSLIQQLKSSGIVKVASAFSHLAASDDPNERSFTLAQIERFKKMSDQLENGLGYPVVKHIANSGAISAYPEAHFDMVRLGIGLYGIGASQADRQHLQVVSELTATVSQVKQLRAGDSVGYGRSFVADGPMAIAVVSIGYADGFRRSLGNGVGEVAIGGKRYPVVGRVCMDMMMVDVSGSKVQEGDRVEIFGPTISVYELAQKMGTIPYEVLTGISYRVKRVYYME